MRHAWFRRERRERLRMAASSDICRWAHAATCLGNPVDARRDRANTGRVQRRALTILLRAAPWLVAALVLSGCATSTAPGAVGVTRSQLMIVPSAAVAARAAEGYARIPGEASQAGRLNTDAALTARVRGVGRQLIVVAGSFRPDAAGWIHSAEPRTCGDTLGIDQLVRHVLRRASAQRAAHCAIDGRGR